MFGSKAKRNAELRQKEIENGKKLVERTELNDIDGVRQLLNQGVNVDAVEYNRFLFYKSQNYMTPLQIAAKNGSTELLTMFLEWENESSAETANVDASDRFDMSAVHFAAENGQLDCLRLLLDAGADVNIAIKRSKHDAFAVPHIGGTTALHLATRERHLECVNELILNGADYNAIDLLGQTSLYNAADLGYEEIVMAHLNNAVGRDILSLPINHTKETPLHECLRHGLVSCVEALLERGSDVNHQNFNGYSALHMALHNSETFNFSMVKTLVLKGYRPDLNLRDKSGVTPLQYVTFGDSTRQLRRPQVAAFLIAYGARIPGLSSKHGLGVLEAELQSTSTDFTILNAAVKSMAKLPACSSIGEIARRTPASIRRQHLARGHGGHQHGLPPNLAAGGGDSVGGGGGGAVSPPDHEASSNIVLRKWEWYNELCRSPRSLQHYCRCVVRNTLATPERLRNIPQLCLPTSLKQYLLLEFDEYR